MAGKSRFRIATALLRPFQGEILNFFELKKLVYQVCSTERGIQGYFNMMKETGMISEEEHLKFRINEIRPIEAMEDA